MTLAPIVLPKPLAPETVETIRDLESRFAVATRQRELLAQYIRDRLKPEKHYYTVRAGGKPSLTKDGAELICLPHGYKPMYFKEAGPDQPPEDNTPYQITVRCRLMHGDSFGGEGFGSASSHITTKEGVRQVRQADIGLRHNATLKMAQKSAYVAATLNATAASEFFTQDMEEAGAQAVPQAQNPEPTHGLCPFHNVAYVHRTGKTKAGGAYDFWACPEKVEPGTGRGTKKDYCPNAPGKETLVPAPAAAGRGLEEESEHRGLEEESEL